MNSLIYQLNSSDDSLNSLPRADYLYIGIKYINSTLSLIVSKPIFINGIGLNREDDYNLDSQ
jgi:hypothetical protein